MTSLIQAITSSRTARAGAALTITLAGMTAWSTTSAADDKTILTLGTEELRINSRIFSDLRFSPGQTTVKSGADLTLSHHDKTEEPHTLTIVAASERPAGADVFDCGSPGTLCDEVFNTVGPQIVDDTKAQFVNIAGQSGLDGRLDTVYLPAGTSLTVHVTAPAGTKLSYFCAIHPWMQGDITVS
jgi:plastocyanin